VSLIIVDVHWILVHCHCSRHIFSNSWGLLCEDCSNNLFYNLFFVNLAKSDPEMRWAKLQEVRPFGSVSLSYSVFNAFTELNVPYVS